MERSEAARRAGVPAGEAGLIDVEALGARIKAARYAADPPMKHPAMLAQAMATLGCVVTPRKVWDWEGGRSVPDVTAFFTLVAATAPPGGLKFFAPTWPELWPLIEAGMNGGSGR